MGLTQGLHQKQTTSLVLTPQLRQAIHLLSLNNLELHTHLQQEILENPLLEMVWQEETPPAQEKTDSGEEEWASPTSQAHENLWSNDSQSDRWTGSTGGSSSGAFEGEGSSLRVASHPVSLQAHLMSQIHTCITNPEEKIMAAHLLADLDEAGYLTTSLEALAARLGCEEVHLETTLQTLQSFDPAGVFARHLCECLSLQLKDQGEWTPDLENLLTYLPLFAEGKMEPFFKKTGLTREKITQGLSLLRRLDPKPGLAFAAENAQTIVPDLYVSWDPLTQGWEVRFNEGTLPKVLLDTGYYAKVSKTGEKDIQIYLKEKMASANWLVKALDQRAQTILRVATTLVATQSSFLRLGLAHLQPLTLREVAASLELHESTISRVIQNKYLQTPRGVFEMKMFFSNAVMGMSDEEQHSATSVRHLLGALVAEEDPKDPYSDDQLVQKMAERGVDVARRTISKYRRILKIPSSYERRRTQNQAAFSKTA